MIICVQIQQRTKDQLDRLLNVGQYRDYSEAVAVAISNQLLLHDSSGPGCSQPTQSEVAQPEIAQRHQGQEVRQSGWRASSDEDRKRIPSLFSAISGDVIGIKAAPFPKEAIEIGQEISADQWIFGQHNKLLPVKATCRALANLFLKDPTNLEGLPLLKSASEIAAQAVILGDVLRQVDQETEADRDEALAFAFPRSDSRNSDKSRLRFANQFVASLTKQGLLTGLPAELKFVNCDESRVPKLLLTDAGLHFALLGNPILDGPANQSKKKFSDEEVSFFVQHILMNVPAEQFAFRAVLSAITDGANTPDQLDEALEQFLPNRDVKPFTRAFLTTQRAGVISRLSDLGLVQRIREGIKVTYRVTARTLDFAPLSLARTV
jgi:hypothetical protein